MKMSSKMPLTSMICAETLEKNSSNYDGQELEEESPIQKNFESSVEDEESSD